jgi:hypothetical protein
VNPTEVSFWLEWYECLDAALAEAEGSIVACKDPDGRIRYAVDEEALPAFQGIRELFRNAGEVRVFEPRPPHGTQVWPPVAAEGAAAERLLQLLEEPAHLAQDGGFRTEDPDAPAGLCRLIDLLEAQIYCRDVSVDAVARCPAWSRIMPELFADGADKIVAAAVPSFDLLAAQQVDAVLKELKLPREVMSPFLPYVDKPLTLARIVDATELP